MTAIADVRIESAAGALHDDHTADRSSWDCRVCGQPWPCAPGKVALAEEFLTCPSLLIMFLVSTFYEAQESYPCRELPTDLFERIVMWAVRRINR